jgi:hypothetical protein
MLLLLHVFAAIMNSRECFCLMTFELLLQISTIAGSEVVLGPKAQHEKHPE